MDNPFSDKALFAKGLWALGLPALIDRKGENINLVVSEKDIRRGFINPPFLIELFYQKSSGAKIKAPAMRFGMKKFYSFSSPYLSIAICNALIAFGKSLAPRDVV